VGTTVEFSNRGTFEPVTGMNGGGPFNLQPGQWADDTSMALCLAASLVEKGGFDARDQMERYWRWLEQGYMSSTGHCFDIGGTVYKAMQRFVESDDPFSGSTHRLSAGNGCIMRLAPVPMFFAHDHDAAVHHSAESSRTTHGAAECLDACRLLGSLLVRTLNGASRDELLFGKVQLRLREPKICDLAAGAYVDKKEHEVRGSGYVVESLEAALWCFLHTDSYHDAILKAANLGDDADTTAAITGQLAGAYYGIEGIPSDWLDKLTGREMIEGFARDLLGPFAS
jgi:ADP-ribosyl-[dinitrogen reductase] hydrolase